MKRKTLILLVLFLLVLYIRPVNLGPSSAPPAIGNESQFIMSADGDESTESITSFSETLADDALFYPDGFDNITVASAGSYDGETSYGTDYTYTQVKDDSWFEVVDNSIPGLSVIYLNFTREGAQSLSLASFCIGSEAGTVDVWDGASWDNFGAVPSSYGWVNFTIAQSYVIDDLLSVRWNVSNAGAMAGISVDYAAIDFEYMTLADADHYAESFADVSDWTTSDTSITTDDDVATITENGAGSTGRAYASFSSTDFFEYYYEFRIETMTATTANLEFWDGDSYETLKTFTAAGTYKGIISDTDAATLQRIGFLVGSEGGNIKPDYLRISLSTETGWQHDGSTTAGVADGIGDFTYSSYSDGETLNLTVTRTSMGAAWGNISIVYDTTTTAADLELDYYQFCEVRYRVPSMNNPEVRGIPIVDGVYEEYVGILDYGVSDWTTVRINLAAMNTATSRTPGFVFACYQQFTDMTTTIEIDYIKYYSIANFTYSDSSVTTDDYLYVSSSILYSNIDSGYMEMNLDPALTVNAATYNVWNVTTQSTAPQSAYYVAGWSSYSSDMRGPLSSGTLTDLKLKLTTSHSVSALKFIEDSTIPTVVRSFATPADPDADEAVTLAAVCDDTTDVSSVNFNAITSPTGFSDVDYSATEIADNLWTYEFSTLIAGYYCFKVIASDGFNVNELTEYAYISLTVREAAIQLDPINLEGADPDSTYMQVSFECNKAGNWSITEWVQSDGSDAAETNTGNVSEGWNNIAWEKLDTSSTVVYFNMTVMNGSLSVVKPGLYLVAQDTFYVENGDMTESHLTVTVSGHITKTAAYTVYDDVGNVRNSGTITDLDFRINFDKWEKNTMDDVFFAIRFSNGTQVCWYNNTYFAFDPDDYGIAPPAVQPRPSWATDMLYWQGFASVVFLIFIIIYLIRAVARRSSQ